MGNTVASQFRAQLRSLMDIINSTTPHFIRCIKPNAECAPNVIDKALVINQLKCGGVLEAARVSRLGECVAAEDFAQRCSFPPPF
jgi:myosin-5